MWWGGLLTRYIIRSLCVAYVELHAVGGHNYRQISFGGVAPHIAFVRDLLVLCRKHLIRLEKYRRTEKYNFLDEKKGTRLTKY